MFHILGHTITVTKIKGIETIWYVEATLANGFSNILASCESEEQARTYVRGLQDGFALVKNAIDVGLGWNGNINQKSVDAIVARHLAEQKEKQA